MAIRGIPLLIGRAFAVRPGTPADRVAILRDALAKTIADPQFQAEAKKAKIDMEYISAAGGDQGLRRDDEPAAGRAGGDGEVSAAERINFCARKGRERIRVRSSTRKKPRIGFRSIRGILAPCGDFGRRASSRFLLIASAPASALAQADFYRGKTVTSRDRRTLDRHSSTRQIVSRHMGALHPR